MSFPQDPTKPKTTRSTDPLNPEDDLMVGAPDAPNAPFRVPRSDDEHLQKIREVNPEFADTALGFLNFARERGVQDVYIKSGYRTAKRQNDLHRAGFPTKGNDGYVKISPHQQARAIDFSTKSATTRAKMHNLLKAYAQKHKLYIPHDEPWHLAGPPPKGVTPSSKLNTLAEDDLDPDLPENDLMVEPPPVPVAPVLTKRQQAQAAMAGEPVSSAAEMPSPAPQPRDWREKVKDFRERNALPLGSRPQDLEFGGMTTAESEDYARRQQQYSQIDAVSNAAVARMAQQNAERQQRAVERRRQAQEAMKSGPPLTTNDAAWHFGVTPAEAPRLGLRARKVLADQVAEDDRRRQAGEEIPRPTLASQNAMRQRAGLPPLKYNIGQREVGIGNVKFSVPVTEQSVAPYYQPHVSQSQHSFRTERERLEAKLGIPSQTDYLPKRFEASIDPAKLRPEFRKDAVLNTIINKRGYGALEGTGGATDAEMEQMAIEAGLGPDIEREQDRLVNQALAEEQRYSRGPLGPLATTKEIFSANPAKLAPLLGAVVDYANQAELADAIGRQRQGSATERDKLTIQRAAVLQNESRPFATKLAEGLIENVPFMAEFLISGGTAAPVRAGIRQALTQSLPKVAARKAGEFAIKAGAELPAAAARLPYFIPRVMEGYEQRVMQGEDPTSAKFYATLDTYTEILSEASGGAAKYIPGLNRFKAPGWLERGYQKLQKAGYHGTFTEYAEERVKDVMDMATGVRGSDEVVKKWQDPEQHMLELAQFAVPGVAAAGLNKAAELASGQPASGSLEAANIPREPEIVPPSSEIPSEARDVTPPAPTTPRAEERPGTIVAQFEAMMAGRGSRKATILPAKTDSAVKAATAPMPQGVDRVVTPEGDVVVFRPDVISREQVQELLRTGRSNELTGLPNPESPRATLVAIARVAEGPNKGEERLAGYIEPENVEQFRREAIAQFPTEVLRFEFGGKETEQKIIADREAAPQTSITEGSQIKSEPVVPPTASQPVPAPESTQEQPPAVAAAKPSASTGVAKPASLATPTPTPESPLLDRRLDQYIGNPTLREVAQNEMPDVVEIARNSPTWREFQDGLSELGQDVQRDGPRGGQTRELGGLMSQFGAREVYEALRSLRPKTTPVSTLESSPQQVADVGTERRDLTAPAPTQERRTAKNDRRGVERADIYDVFTPERRAEIQQMIADARPEDVENMKLILAGRMANSELVTRSAPKQKDYVDFPPESGTLGIARASMPQIKSEHRGALVNRLKARGITYTEEEVLPGDLKPSQAEYSPAKVDRARSWTGPERKLLVSSDGHVLDGHHQWKQKLEDFPNRPIPIFRLSVPAREALLELSQFPSSEVQGSHGDDKVALRQPESVKRGSVSQDRGPELTEEPGSSPVAPPGPRWYSDRGAQPGMEPSLYLDVKGDDLDTAKAAIWEIDVPEQGKVYYEVVEPADGGARVIGRFSTVADAAYAAEQEFPDEKGETRVSTRTDGPRAARGDEGQQAKEGVEEKEEKPATAAAVEEAPGQPEVLKEAEDARSVRSDEKGGQGRAPRVQREGSKKPRGADVRGEGQGRKPVKPREGTPERPAEAPAPVAQAPEQEVEDDSDDPTSVFYDYRKHPPFSDKSLVTKTDVAAMQAAKQTEELSADDISAMFDEEVSKVAAEETPIAESQITEWATRLRQLVSGLRGQELTAGRRQQLEALFEEGQRFRDHAGAKDASFNAALDSLAEILKVKKPTSAKKPKRPQAEEKPVEEKPAPLEGEYTPPLPGEHKPWNKRSTVEIESEIEQWAESGMSSSFLWPKLLEHYEKRTDKTPGFVIPVSEPKPVTVRDLAQDQFREKLHGIPEETQNALRQAEKVSIREVDLTPTVTASKVQKFFNIPDAEWERILRSGERDEWFERYRGNYAAIQQGKKEAAQMRSAESEAAERKLPVSLAKRLLALPNEQRATAYGPSNKQLRRDIYQALTGNKPTDKTTGSMAITKLLALNLAVDTANKAGVEVEEGIIAKLREIAGLPAEPTRAERKVTEEQKQYADARQRKAEEEGELEEEIPIAEADIDSMESVKKTGSVSRGNVTVRVIEMETGTHGVEVQIGAVRQRPLPGTGKPLEQAQVEAVERLNARAPLTQESMQAMYDEIDDGDWSEDTVGAEIWELWGTIPADTEEFTQDQGFKMVRILKAVKASQEKKPEARNEEADAETRRVKAQVLVDMYSKPGVAKHWLHTIQEKGDATAKKNLRRNVDNAVLGWTEDPELNAAFHGDNAEDYNRYIDEVTDQVFDAIQATKPSAETREPAREKAIGVITGSKVDRLEEKGWTTAYGDIGKGDRYYDVVGVVSGGPADRFREAGLTILYPAEAAGLRKENEPTPEWWSELTTHGKREMFKAVGLKKHIGTTHVTSWQNLSRGEQHALATRHLADKALAAEKSAPTASEESTYDRALAAYKRLAPVMNPAVLEKNARRLAEVIDTGKAGDEILRTNNTVSRKVFTELTGVNLGRTERDAVEAVEKWVSSSAEPEEEKDWLGDATVSLEPTASSPATKPPTPSEGKYRVDVQGVGDTRWNSNAKRFATPKEADDYGDDLLMRWSGAKEYRVVPVDTPEREQVTPEQLKDHASAKALEEQEQEPEVPIAAPLREVTKEEAEARWERAKAEQAERAAAPAAPVKLNGYISFYKGKQLEVYAPTQYAASQEAAKHFKAKRTSDVRSELADKDVTPPPGAIVVGAPSQPVTQPSIETMTSEELVRRMHSSNRERVNRGEGGGGLRESITNVGDDPYAAEYNKRRFRGGRPVIAAPTKPSLASATKALSDIFDEEEEEPGGSAQFARMEPEFDEAKYALAEPQFVIALRSFQQKGLSLAQSVPAMVRYLNTEAGYSAAKIARMKPYVVRFVMNVQAGKVNLSEEVATTQTPEQSGTQKLAQAVVTKLNASEKMNNPLLLALADRAFGGTIAQGRYTVKDAYDALELGVNQYLLQKAPAMLEADSQQALRELRDLMSLLPRQTDRTTETDQLQQFSTPPTLAFVAAKALNIQPTDIMEEPSAGTGNLALWGQAAGATVETNEIHPRRRQILEYLGFTPTKVDAELLNDLLPLHIKPTVVLMNPPFSATGGRTATNDTKFGARHIEQALLRLASGGRAVIITGEGMAIGKHKFSDWWKRIMSRYNVRANLGIPGDEYGKYGTTFGTQLLVIDKTGPTPGASPAEQLQNVRFGDVKSLEEALNELQPIIADRPVISSDSVGSDKGDVRRSGGERAPTPDRGSELPGSGRPGTVIRSTGPGRTSESDSGVQRSEPRTGPEQPERSRPLRSRSRGAEDVRLTDGLTAVPEPDFVPTDLGLTYARRTETREAEESGTFVKYRPAKLGGAVEHPANIVESASMAAVEPPDISYVPKLPKEIVTEGKLSDLQLESVSYAGQRFEQRLPGGARAGYFIGDGTGVGKGREVSGVILDQWNRENRRTLWLSVSKDLIEDASRDLKDIGAGHIPLASISDFAPADDIKIPKGVIFSTYNSLISAAKTGNKQKRREQLEKWLGDDGIIIFDEAHKAKNALAQGQSEPTQTGQAVIDIQTNLPNARVVYASATGATDVRNMAYMVRLGLWGPGTSFPGGFTEFMTEIDRGGVGAMEMVSRDMKALGMYVSRSISFEGVDYQETIHELTPEQRRVYDAAANAMQVVLQNINEALGLTNAHPRAKMAAMQRFWADHQRLFRQLISSFKVPTVIHQTEKALAEGKSVVIGLIGTGESRTKEQVTKALSVGGDLEDLDFSPREFVANLVDKAFPTNVYQEVTDETTGKTTMELVRDENGNPVVSQEALALKEQLLDQLSDLHLPENPLDQIVNYFGEKKVAEMTGRKRRLIRGPDGKLAYKKRAPDGIAMTRVNVHENRQFQSGKKRVAIISDAAATGISLHSSNREENKQRRVHMTLELGWSADKQMQTFGRTHRSDQAIPPEYDLISTDIGGEKRFSSTIARRLASLGALTKGQRDATGGGDLAKYNFETEEGKAALTRFYSNILRGVRIEGIENPQQALRDMGILRERKDQGEVISDEDMVDVPRFLNRILALDLDRQNVLFGEFARTFDQTIDFAKENGTFDEGVADIKGESVRMKAEPTVVFTDQVTGAETTHYQLEVDVKTEPVEWDRAKILTAFEKSNFYKQKRSGNIIIASESGSHTDPATGFVFKTYAVTTPTQERDHFIRDNELATKYEQVKRSTEEDWWKDAVSKIPPIRTTETHIIGGAILPLWQRLKTDEGARLKVVRVLTDDGQRVVGIQVPTKQIASVLRSLGLGRELKSPEEIFTAVLDQDDVIKLAGGLVLAKGRLHGDEAIEVRGAEYQHFNGLRQMGLINERIDWKQKFFVPTDMETGIPALTMLLGSYPAIDAGAAPQSEPEEDGPQFSETPRGWEKAESGPVEEPEFSVQGDHITLNAAGRQLMSDAYGLTDFKYRMPPSGIGGVYTRAPEELATALERLADQQPDRAEGARALASAVREAGSDGTVSLAYGEKQRRHEEVHRTAHQASGMAAVNERHGTDGFQRLENHPAWSTIKDALLRKRYPDQTPVLIDEAFAYLATGDNLGLSDEEADSWMEEWIRSFKEKNGSVSITKFKELSDAAERARERVYAEGDQVDRGPGGGVPGVSGRRTEGASPAHGEGTREPWQIPRAASGLTENQHREVVAQAINTSKNVPASVLVEYPGLAESIRFEQAQMAQVDQTNTETFKRWFGDSKIVDENGNPQVVYHFTTKDAEQGILATGFDPSPSRARARRSDEGVPDGIFFTPQGESVFSDQMDFARLAVYLKMESPLRVDNRADLIAWTAERDPAYADLSKSLAKYTPPVYRKLMEDLQSDDAATKNKAELAHQALIAAATTARRHITDLLKREGHDGVIMERDEGGPQVISTYIVLEPTQIKSATGNRGTFDPNDPNVLFAEHEPDPWERLLRLAEEIQRPEGMEARRLPKTMEAAQLETGENLFYEPTTISSGIEAGRQMVDEKGIDGAMEFVRTGDGIGWASTGYEVLAQLRAEESRIRPTDEQAADRVAEKRLKFLDEFVERSTELGRSIVGIKAIEVFAPDRAAYHLNKLSKKRRKHGISKEEEADITAMALELQRINDENRALQQNIDYRIEVARALEEDLAAAETRARRRERYQPGEAGEREGREGRRPLMHYEIQLEKRAQSAKDALLVKVGNLNFGNLKVSAGKFPKQEGKAGPNISELPGDAELLAQYAAGQIASFDTVAELNTHLTETFGQDIEPYLPAVRQRAWQIRRDARIAELNSKETEAPRRRTILAEIQAEIAAGQRAIREMEEAQKKAERERERKELSDFEAAEKAVKEAKQAVMRARNAEVRKEAKEQLRKAKEVLAEKGRTKPISPKSERRVRMDEIKEAKQRLKDTREEYQEASKAENKAWRQIFKNQREAARTAALWDTPLRRAAADARVRLAGVTDLNDPQVMEDLTAVAAEKFLPDEPGGPVRKRSIDPSHVYVELLDEFPNLVTKKNQGEIYKRGYQRILDATAAAREAAVLRSAQNESSKMWEKLGIDTEAQALLIKRAENRRKQQELRHKMTQEFERVGRSRLAHFLFELNALPRSAKSSIDAPELRQGLFAYLTHPKAIAPTVLSAAKGYAAIHPTEYHALVEQLQQLPRYDGAQRAGLDLPEIVGENDPRVHTEESFQSGWGQKIPHIRVSEQAFVLSMNHKRMTLWNILAPVGEAHGYTWENNPEFFKQLAALINDITGRGNVPESMARFMSTWMNWFFFAARYNVSKVQLLNDLFNPFKYISAEWAPTNPALKAFAQGVKDVQGIPGFSPYDPVMRKIAFEQVIRWFGAMMALALAAYVLGFKIELDPDDPDFFPKLRWGNTTYDFSGGEVGTVRFLYRFLKGITKMATGMPVSKREHPWQLAMGERGFIRQKLSPWAGAFINFLSGTDVMGDKTTLSMPLYGWYKQGFMKTMKEDILVDMIMPIIVNDMIEAASDSGWVGVAKTVPAFAGLGVQTYPDKEPPSDTQQLMFRKLAAQREQTPEDRERQDLMRKLEEDIRQGKPVVAEVEKAVREGKLLPADRVEIARSAQLKPEQLTFKQLNVVDAMDVYEAASEAERALFKQLLIDKGPNVWNLAEPEQEAAAARFEKITGQKPPERRRRKFAPNWWKRLQKQEGASPIPTPPPAP